MGILRKSWEIWENSLFSWGNLWSSHVITSHHCEFGKIHQDLSGMHRFQRQLAKVSMEVGEGSVPKIWEGVR